MKALNSSTEFRMNFGVVFSEILITMGWFCTSSYHFQIIAFLYHFAWSTLDSLKQRSPFHMGAFIGACGEAFFGRLCWWEIFAKVHRHTHPFPPAAHKIYHNGVHGRNPHAKQKCVCPHGRTPWMELYGLCGPVLEGPRSGWLGTPGLKHYVGQKRLSAFVTTIFFYFFV